MLTEQTRALMRLCGAASMRAQPSKAQRPVGKAMVGQMPIFVRFVEPRSPAEQRCFNISGPQAMLYSNTEQTWNKTWMLDISNCSSKSKSLYSCDA